MRPFCLLLCVLSLVLCACAKQRESDFEPTVKVRGQYDAAFGIYRK